MFETFQNCEEILFRSKLCLPQLPFSCAFLRKDISKISTWGISKIIAKYCGGKSFSQYRTYLALKEINSAKLKKLEEKEFISENISIAYIKFLLSKNRDSKEISKLLKIPLTKLEKYLSKIKESDRN